MLGERLIAASNRRAAKLDNSYGSLPSPGSYSLRVSPDKVRALPPGAKDPDPIQLFLSPPFATFGSHCRAESYTASAKALHLLGSLRRGFDVGGGAATGLGLPLCYNLL